MNRLEKEHSRKEDLLKQEISDVQQVGFSDVTTIVNIRFADVTPYVFFQRLQEAEDRNQDLTHGVSAGW